jgi:hypothetical protein
MIVAGLPRSTAPGFEAAPTRPCGWSRDGIRIAPSFRECPASQFAGGDGQCEKYSC